MRSNPSQNESLLNTPGMEVEKPPHAVTLAAFGVGSSLFKIAGRKVGVDGSVETKSVGLLWLLLYL